MSHWIFNQLSRSKHWFIQELNKRLALWVSHWIIHQLSLQNTDSFNNKRDRCESLNHSFNWVIQNTDIQELNKRLSLEWVTESFINWVIQNTDSFKLNKQLLYEWVMNHSINWVIQNWFIQELNKRLALRVSHWIIQSTESFKNWFIQELNKRLALRVSHWIIQSTESFKTLIHSRTKQALLYEWVMNHNQLSRSKHWFIQS